MFAIIDDLLVNQVFNNLSLGILIYDKHGQITWCNQPASQILGQEIDRIATSYIELFLPTINTKVPGDLLFIPGQNKEVLICDLVKPEHQQFTTVLFLDIKSGELSAILYRSRNHPDAKATSQTRPKFTFESIIGADDKLLKTIASARKSAKTSSPVLLYGETGTGKELFAQSIHNASTHSDQPFVAINCAAIPEQLLEGILFGTVKGAFTEALNRPGLFEQAAQGTIFLDEINSMPTTLQAKLLRVLQEKTIRRLGGMMDIYVNPKIISSLNTEPLSAIANGMLRSDLFYRLGVVSLHLPPLRERKDDIPLLANFFLNNITRKLEKPVKAISPAVIDFLQAYDWPGNIRQLEHAIECAVNFVEVDTEIAIQHFPRYLRFIGQDILMPENTKPPNSLLKTEIENTEQTKILTILEQKKGNISEAARVLGISRQSLYYRIKKFSLQICRQQDPND